MRIIYLKIHEADASGGLLNGLTLSLDRATRGGNDSLSTLCLVGPNGSGKSQLLQTLAEIFQDAWHTHSPGEERTDTNNGLMFELIYDIEDETGRRQQVKLSRVSPQKRRAPIRMDTRALGSWTEVQADNPLYGKRLPPVIVGYTSGDNETLSLPFFKSRAAYAKDVSSAALDLGRKSVEVPDSKLLLIDYGTNLEVLIANLMLGPKDLGERMLEHAGLEGISSWRCVIQLSPTSISKTNPVNGRRGVKLTDELEGILVRLRACSTSQHHEESTDTYTLDYYADEATRLAFRELWRDASDLYRSFHKFAMLNDLAIQKKARSRLARDLKRRNFATRLPEPQDEQKVFRFEEVRFHPKSGGEPVDYVALSDGEHQQAQIFGVFSMITEVNALFLLDEPESHFNPQWRVKFISRLRSIPVQRNTSREMIMTSHAPFVPSDMQREHVIILKKSDEGVIARNPVNETFGASFDRILKDCFDIEPPISQVAQNEIGRLMREEDADEIEKALPRIGASVEKAFLVDHLNQLKLKDL
ncbi:restriction system-associated AAA family ATPase [Frigoribacterium sp. CFBP 13605]|uniref:restriction system-associated AAA family ATPase n=1 Tax=Frigoribacterium sp. CFBP 13605 TaxID=2774034 RepID=UPI001907275B|nr:restriction system-associated AAA family ATPase [Frigoribacterium sp. CFBP 13605]MBD8140203.1 restriction system-associated AAA family ATPase [Frigoribacterium sp. CFBP 13605]